MAQASDPLFAGIPSLADDQQLSKNSTNNRDSEIQLRFQERTYLSSGYPVKARKDATRLLGLAFRS